MVFKGVRNMGHLMKDSTHFLYFQDFKKRFNIKTNFLTFQGVISMIKALWKSNDENLHTITTNYETFTKIFVGKKQKKMVKAQRK